MDEAKRTKINTWKKKAWMDFCKLVMEQDKRYTLLPLKDYHDLRGRDTLSSDGVFDTLCLCRSGDRADVYITPQYLSLGIHINAGSKYTSMTFVGYPSKCTVWSILRLADELERQYTREVNIETSKPHGRIHDAITNLLSDDDSDKL